MTSILTLVASFLLILPLAQPRKNEIQETAALLRRINRDISGKYRPELHGDKSQLALHSVHFENRGDLGSAQVVSSSFASNSLGEDVHAHYSHSNDGYSYPPEVPPQVPPQFLPPVEPNCGCVQTCGESTLAYTNAVVQARASSLVCGRTFRLCCYDEVEAWPGVIDQFRDVIACVPREDCVRVYGDSPTDVRDFGAIPPCPGHGAVRCLDGKVQLVDTQVIPAPSGPTHFVIPIVEQPIPLQTVQPQPLPVIPTPVTPVVTLTNTPATSYGTPEPLPPLPVPVPTSSYVAPAPVPEPTYVAPAPVPEPTYVAPAPVPEQTYAVPTPVAPEIPSTSYAAPLAVPVEIPSTSYGVPGLAAGQPLGLINRGPWRGLYSRLGGGYQGFGGGAYPGFRGGAYPGYGGGYAGFAGGYPGGFGFRKHLSINKNFGFFG